MLIFMMRMGLAIIRLPVLKLIRSGPDAWIAVLVGTAVGNLIFWLVLRQAAQQPGLTLVQRLERALGPVAGRAVGTCYILLFLWDTMVTSRMYSGLLISQPMPETPTEAFVFLLLLGAAYMARKGPEVIARVGQFVTPIIAGGIAVVLFLGANQMNPRALQPVLGHGWGQVLVASFFPADVHVELMATLMLAPLVRSPKAMVRAGVVGMHVAGLAAAGTAACLIMFFGAPRSQRLVFPLYDIVRATTFGDFFERIDALFIFTWTATTFVKAALLLWACAYGLGQMVRVKDCRTLIRPLALLAGLLSLRAYANQAEVRALIAPQVYTFVALPFLVLFPALLAIVEAVRRPGEKAV